MNATSPADVYRRYVLDAVPRLLGHLDREEHSATAGSFDRDHWSWKFRDFPITMLQTGLVPLAAIWRGEWAENPYRNNPRLLEWIGRAIETTVARQRRDGSFDTVGPNTSDHGVSLAMVYTLATVGEALQEALPAGLRDRMRRAIQRACDFAARSREDYAFISNHQALFALAWERARSFGDDRQLQGVADRTLGEIVARQSREGWYMEYGGADPGYESLGLLYLAQCWRHRPGATLLESMRRAISFFTHCVHPDGSVGGVYGSRQTSLYYPGGFELLAEVLPEARAVATFMRERLGAGNVVTPASCDAENLPSLLHGYLVAAAAVEQLKEGSGAVEAPLPCERRDVLQHFDEAGITVASTRHYYAIATTTKGGACRVFSHAGGRIAYEDAGYLIASGGRLWSSQMAPDAIRGPVGGEDGAARATAREIRSEVSMGAVRQTVLTPGKFVILRLLNLTLFRSLTLAAAIRRLIIAQLVTARRSGPFLAERTLTLHEDRIVIRDRVRARGAGGGGRSGARRSVSGVWLPRSFLAIHMGSAKYFQRQELEPLPALDTTGMAEELTSVGQTTRAFEIRFADDGAPTLVVIADDRAVQPPLHEGSTTR